MELSDFQKLILYRTQSLITVQWKYKLIENSYLKFNYMEKKN